MQWTLNMASHTSWVIVGCILLLTQRILTDQGPEVFPISLTVENIYSNAVSDTYTAHVAEGGVLLGALRRLQETQQDFKFTVKEDPDFGLFLESVNGLAGDENSYWEILAERSGVLTRLDMGIGCYKPETSEHIILRFNSF